MIRVLRQSNLRRAALALLLIAIWNPRFGQQPVTMDLTLVVDRSPSVDPAAADLVLRNLKLQLQDQGLSANLRMAYLDTSDIAAGVDRALAESGAGEHRSLVLLSDGRATRGRLEQSLLSAHRSGVAVYWQPLPSLPVSPGAIIGLQLPARALPEQALPLTAALVAETSGNYTLSINLNGLPIQEHAVTLQAGRTRSLRLWVRAPDPGHHILEAILLGSGTEGSAISTVRSGLTVEGDQPVLLVSAAASGALTEVLAGIFPGPLNTVMPGGLSAARNTLEQASSLVLDNVAIEDMGPTTWELLLNQVTTGGASLLVLGGDRSFHAGGYRHSALEDILPLLSEPARPQSPASVVFLLDRSGSMGSGETPASTLAMANRALELTSTSLLPEDELALVSFADTAHIDLSFTGQAAFARQLAAALPRSAKGGTDIDQGLGEVLAIFENAAYSQKILMLVSDGFVQGSDHERYAAALSELGVRVIALAIGDDPSLESLQRLTRFNKGVLLRVSAIAELPRLAQSRMNAIRAPLQSGPVLPRPVSTDGLSQGWTWPAVEQYPLTRSRDVAAVHLESPQGDPLLASMAAGSGQVFALPAGLGPWTPAWLSWSNVSAALGDIVKPGDSLSTTSGENSWSMAVEMALENFSVKLFPSAGCQDPATLSVRDPAGRQHSFEVECDAHGPCKHEIAAPTPGQYLLTLQCDARSVQQVAYNRAYGEFTSPVASTAEAMLPVGEMIKNWPREGASVRLPLVITCLLFYLAPLFTSNRLTSQRIS